MHWCALCQEHREMMNHLSDDSDVQMTVVNPPPVQEMNSGENKESFSLAPLPSTFSEQTNMELQAV